MADYFVAISEDGVRFKLKRDGTWEPDKTPQNKGALRFRKCNWGDGVEDVKATESAEPDEFLDDLLLYEFHVGGFPVSATFHFVNGLLHLGMYRFKQEHTDDNKFIDDFESLQTLLTSKYGKPKEITDVWLNDLFRDDNEKRGTAVSRGDHVIFVKWNDDETSITLQLTGDNYEIRMAAIYRSIQLEPLAEAVREREKLEGL